MTHCYPPEGATALLVDNAAVLEEYALSEHI